MSHDFAAFAANQFEPTAQIIQGRIQKETQRLSKTKAESEKKRIIAEEALNFVKLITAGDMRLMDQIMSMLQMQYPNYKEGIRQAWQNNATKSIISSTKMDIFSDFSMVEKRLRNMLPKLPRFSWYISLPVRLMKPFTSRDDREMHVLDNPICREWILGMPMIRPSTWKGNLRWMANISGLDPVVLERLFGNRTDEKIDFHKGRLNFYPTFFDHINFNVMTPLDRERRIPKTGPILMESVQHGPNDNSTIGELSILYLSPPSAWKKEDEVIRQVAVDLIQTTNILADMLLSYGFSAKKTTGFGVIKNDFHDKNGIKSGVLGLTGVEPLSGDSLLSDGNLYFSTKLFGNCTEMCLQAQQVAKDLGGIINE